MAAKTPVRKQASTTPASAPANFDAAAVMAQLQKLTERVAATENENERLKGQLKEAQETGSFTDEFGQTVKILDRSMNGVNASIHDRPGTLVEKLDIMEKQAKIRREPFDRERTRAILCGEEVEDLIEFICERCGRGDPKWNGHEELFNEHIEWHRNGKDLAYKGKKKIRAVDQEDDEAAERAVLARLQEKYKVTESGIAVATK